MTAASTLTLKDSDNQNNIELRKTQLYDVSSVPKLGEPKYCNQQTVLNSHSWRSTLTFGDTFHGKYVNTDITYKHDGTRCSSMSKDFPPSNDNDEYLTSSNSLSWEDITTKEYLTPTNFNDMVQSSESSSAEVLAHKKKLQQPLGIIDSVQKPAAMADFLDSTGRSISRDDCHPRLVIPIGPSFQAKVPGWIGPNRKNNIHDGDVDDLETLKWLGTQIWPNSTAGKSINPPAKAVGKGRHELCSCASPGSLSCNRRHVLESRLLLKSGIGPAFLSWKFDKMGEVVLKAWTSEEQRRFESLVKTNPLTRVTNFWELALKHFPSKSKKSLLSYYCNVYMPRSMRLQTGSSLDDLCSDDDQAEDDETEVSTSLL